MNEQLGGVLLQRPDHSHCIRHLQSLRKIGRGRANFQPHAGVIDSDPFAWLQATFPHAQHRPSLVFSYSVHRLLLDDEDMWIPLRVAWIDEAGSSKVRASWLSARGKALNLASLTA